MRRFIFSLMDYRQKRNAAIILVLSTIVALLEAAGVGAILPFVAAIQSPDMLIKFKIWDYFILLFGVKSPQEITVILGLVLLVLYLTKNILASMQIWLQQSFTQKFYTKISTNLLKGYLRKPYIYFVNANSAILVKNVTIETKLIAESVIEPFLLIASEVLVLTAILIILLISAPVVSIVAIFMVAALFGSIYFFSRNYNTSLGEVREKTFAQMSKICSEAFNGIKEIKVVGAEQFFIDKYSEYCSKQARTTAISSTISQIPRLIIETVLIVSLLGSMIILIMTGVNTIELISVLSMYLAAAFRIMPSINRILSATMRLKYFEAGLKVIAPTLTEIMNEKAVSGNNPVPFEFEKSIAINKLTFKYEGTDTYVLNGLDLEIFKGEVIGLIGESGVGKSTFINILLALLNANSGGVFLDGKTIRTPDDIKNWQAMITYVPQNVFIADDTLIHNIAFGIPDKEIDRNLVDKVIREVQLKELIGDLPYGVNTIVGERGTRLSGGQIQRIGLARALYRNRPILILDEATSALDMETEGKIIEGLKKDHADKTILMIAHRYKSLKYCNKIYRMFNGRIIECLTFNDLEDNLSDGVSE